MWLFWVEVGVTTAVAFFMYYIFASFRSPYFPFVIFGWWVSLSMIYLLSTDVSASFYDACRGERKTEEECVKPLAYFDRDTLLIMWEAVYWTTQLLTWLLYPFLQQYVSAYDFRFVERVVRAINNNLAFYGVCTVSLGGIVLYLVIIKGLDWDTLAGTAIVLSNTIGLGSLVVLLGYGLVDVPRRLWWNGSFATTEKRLLAFVAQSEHELHDSQRELLAACRAVRGTLTDVPSSSPWRPYVDLVASKCPDRVLSRLVHGDEIELDVTYQSLVALHKRVVLASLAVRRAEVDYEGAVLDTLRLLKENETFNWFAFFKRAALKSLALFCLVLSVVTVWSEMTFAYADGQLSVWQLLVHSQGPDWFLQLILMGSLSYIAYCTFHGLFQLRIFNLYRLRPNRETDIYSLFLNAGFFTRLIAPIAYNYLLLIGEGGDSKGSSNETSPNAFDEVMSNMHKVLSHIGTFNKLLPILILVFSIMTLFNLVPAVTKCLSIRTFRFLDAMDEELIQQGRTILEREQRCFEEKNATDDNARRQVIRARSMFDPNFDIAQFMQTHSSDVAIRREESIGWWERTVRLFSFGQKKEENPQFSALDEEL